MPKCSLLTSLLGSLRQVRLISALFYLQCLLAVITFFSYTSFYDYKSIPRDEIDKLLLKAVNPRLKIDPSKPNCTYELLNSDETLYGERFSLETEGFRVGELLRGSYSPPHCSPAFSVAILVTYRGRQEQLDIFLPYIHNFLRRQNIHYKVFLIEQQDGGLWNKGALYNIGARAALAEQWPCLVLHDVDLLPLDAANLYACLHQPRHLSAAIDKFRYVLPYPTLVGGVAAISAAQFARVNGLSNLFTGWGGEDDNFADRLANARLDILRFPREMSRYTMLVHRPERANPARHAARREALRRAGDGLADVAFRHVRRVDHRLFTLLAVTL